MKDGAFARGVTFRYYDLWIGNSVPEVTVEDGVISSNIPDEIDRPEVAEAYSRLFAMASEEMSDHQGDKLHQLMQKRADDSAAADLESVCVPFQQHRNGSFWYDSNRCDARDIFEAALEYVRLRGESLPWRVVWHSKHKRVFRIEAVE